MSQGEELGEENFVGDGSCVLAVSPTMRQSSAVRPRQMATVPSATAVNSFEMKPTDELNTRNLFLKPIKQLKAYCETKSYECI